MEERVDLIQHHIAKPLSLLVLVHVLLRTTAVQSLTLRIIREMFHHYQPRGAQHA